MLHFLRHFIAISLCLACCACLGVLSWVSGKHALAAVNAHLTNGPKESSVTLDATRQALLLAPYNAEYRRNAAVTALRRLDLAEGHERVVQGLQLRPAWPYDWLLLVRMLGLQSVFDERMTLALERSQSLGSAERALQYDTAVTAFAFWYHLSEEQRSLALPSIHAVLHRKRDARRLAVVIEQLQRVDLFCRRMVDFVEYGPAWCAAFEQRRQQRERAARSRQNG